MTQTSYTNPSPEEWQNLVAWEADICDPMFESDTGYVEGEANYHLSESSESEQPYLASAPPSLAEGLHSLQHTVSEPPSILDESSSLGQILCTPSSFGNAIKSPLVGFGNNRYFGSFDASNSAMSPLSYPQESPILDTRYERIPDNLSSTGSYEASTENVFNPYVTGSSHSFSGLDVRASQMLNVGTWAEQPQIIESIVEADEYNPNALPIPIVHPHQSNLARETTSYSRSADRSRAVTIPQTSRRPASHNAASSQPQHNNHLHPALSVSPVSCRRPRSVTLSTSKSRTASRRGVITPSPTSEGLGWVSYQINTNTNCLAPVNVEGTRGRTARGRKTGLTTEQRTNAALMRIIGACNNCQKRKERCDPGTPCKSCLDHYKGDLVNHPCRDRVLSDQASAFLSKGLGWHPTARPLDSFLHPSCFTIMYDTTYTIPLYFGFGPELSVLVHPLRIDASQQHIHEHAIYPWPPVSGTPDTVNYAVLPAVLTRESQSCLVQILDDHLSLLVLDHFRHFPLFCSPLRVLRDVYVYFRSLPTSCTNYQTLHQALKLLVLVHIGGDIAVPSCNTHPILYQLAQSTIGGASDDFAQTPCFIRSQFGHVMPGLALCLMKHVLTSLEKILLSRDCDDWPMALAVTLTLLMIIDYRTTIVSMVLVEPSISKKKRPQPSSMKKKKKA
ncbi:hypothetical protein ACEQ8H_000140 [Pleosporales sp. CAS-2024a]